MENKKYSDLFLANQEFASHLYRDRKPYEAALYELVASYAAEFESKDLVLATPERIGFEEMSSPPFFLALLNALVSMSDAKNVLEIGTFVGHTSMQLARMVGKDGRVTTLERGKEFADLARKNIARNGFAERVVVIEGDAAETLKLLPENSFDLVFIDGAKQSYLEYALRSEALLTPNGVIIVDDVFFHGDALNETPKTDKGLGCKRLLQHYAGDRRFDHLLLPVRNGILVLFKRKHDHRT